ncbi:MAG: tRNA-dihydrouridine synthase [Roseburia faecis]
MLFYLAPMEGITGYIVRNAYAHYFPYIDKYFTPFIPAAKKMSKKIKRDLAAENNGRIRLVPQLIGNRADEFLMMIRQLEDLGFTSVNLNFGCPSGTVVSKRKVCRISGRSERTGNVAGRSAGEKSACGIGKDQSRNQRPG